jgi:hypothetical protein
MPSYFPQTNFGVRWSTQVICPVTGTYSFTVVVDDGARLYIDGNLMIDEWIVEGSTSYSTTINAVAMQGLNLTMEYFQAGGGAAASLYWTKPGGSSVILEVPTGGGALTKVFFD